MESSKKFIAFPLSGIAYNEALYAQFEALGARVVEGIWGGRWLLENIQSGDVVHLHWPSFHYASKKSLGPVAIGFLRFLLLLAIVRLRTREIWWTAHNLFPHERSPIPALDTVARALVIRLARVVFVHGGEAEKVLLEHFPAASGKTVKIPHGNWIGQYPALNSKAQARVNLKLPADAFVYLHFGQCKPYKNLLGLIEVFLKTARNDEMLLVAGGFSDPAYLARVRDAIGGDPRVRIDEGYIPDENVSDYVVACDAMCMPYLEILTSGTAMLAMSYGRPVLSVRRGFLRDVVTPECGVLVEPADPQALADGLRTLRARVWVERDILAVAAQYQFRDAARLSIASLDKSGQKNKNGPI